MKRIALGVFSQENATEKMLEYVRRNHELEAMEQWRILKRPGAKKILLEYVRHGGLLCYGVEYIIFRLWPKSDTAEIMLEYAKNGILPDVKFLPRLFKLPDAKEIFLEFVKHNPDGLREKVQLQILNRPYADEIMLESVKRGGWLCYDAQVRMFDQPDAGKIFLEYVRHRHELCYGAQVRIFDLPDAEKFFWNMSSLESLSALISSFRFSSCPMQGTSFLNTPDTDGRFMTNP